VATFGPTETHTTIARAEGSLGTGPVTVETNTIMVLDKTSSADWALSNTLAGAGTFKVEDGAGTNTLTVLGTVDPGTNGVAVTTNSTGILRVDGDLAFGTGSRLRIHIAGTNGVAGVDYDRLVVDHDLTGLSNAVLEIGGSTNLVKVTLTGQELVVVSNATTLAGEFAAVEWTSPWRGKVKYNDPPGTVKLIEVSSASSPGMVLMVQ
jgi:flagellar basal body rod protein FlgG